jgi:hypothetical protein
MTRPSILVRVAGTPAIAFCLSMLYLFVMVNAIHGAMPWWIGVAAFGLTFRTLRALRTVRAYKLWMKDWQAMGSLEEPKAKARSRRRPLFSGVNLLLAFGLFAILFYIFVHQYPVSPVVLWGARLLLIYLLVGVPVVIVRRLRGRLRVKDSEKEVPVKWLLPRASSSPTLHDARRALPEYAARVLDQ